MKYAVTLALCLTTTLGSLPLLADSPLHSTKSHLHGTSIFHWTVRKAWVPPDPDLEQSPYGFVRLTHKIQGKADKQGMLLVARRLEANTSYRLWAWHGETPEAPPSLLDPDTEYTLINTFESSPRGNAILRSKKIHTSRGSQSVSEKIALPPDLDPLHQVGGLVITTGDDENRVVLTADLSQAERFQILVRRELENVASNPETNPDADAEGVVHLKGHHRRGWFRLHLAGLEPNSDYFLVTNDREENATALVTDDYGRASTWTLLDQPSDMLALRALTVTDQNGDPVLTTAVLEP